MWQLMAHELVLIWRHFWLSWLVGGACWHLVSRGQIWCKQSTMHETALHQRMIWIKVPTVPSLRNPDVDLKDQKKESPHSRTQGMQIMPTQHTKPHNRQYLRYLRSTREAVPISTLLRVTRGNHGSLPLLSDTQHCSYVIINLGLKFWCQISHQILRKLLPMIFNLFWSFTVCRTKKPHVAFQV